MHQTRDDSSRLRGDTTEIRPVHHWTMVRTDPRCADGASGPKKAYFRTIMRRPTIRPLVLSLALVLVACAPSGVGVGAETTRMDPAPSASATRDRSTPAPAEPTALPSVRPEPTEGPIAAAEPTAAPPVLEPYAMNLYGRGDFVRQYTFDWCVGASLQMMLNLADADDPDTRARQEALWELARDRSSSPFGGANPRGWTAALNELGIGPYELVSIADYDEALRRAAAAIRATERPVGLVMWRGRHAWVMSGFESNGDPLDTNRFEVTGIRVLDPLHPHGSSVWGPSPKPNSLLTPEQLAKQYVIRDSRRVNLGVGPGFLLVLPVERSAPAAALPGPYRPIS
jgi:hypothetical protein